MNVRYIGSSHHLIHVVFPDSRERDSKREEGERVRERDREEGRVEYRKREREASARDSLFHYTPVLFFLVMHRLSAPGIHSCHSMISIYYKSLVEFSINVQTLAYTTHIFN